MNNYHNCLLNARLFYVTARLFVLRISRKIHVKCLLDISFTMNDRYAQAAMNKLELQQRKG